MADWFLVPCLVALRGEFNDLAPRRDKGADGSIGDLAHQNTSSDHNPDPQGRVLAVDIDSSGPWPGFAFDAAVMFVVARCRSGTEDRIEYIIWNRFIYRRSTGFAKQTYTGSSDPHTNHAHFSARHDHHGESNTRPWGLLEEFDMPTADEIVDKLLGTKLGASGPTVGVALQNGISDAARDKILSASLGSSGPSVSVALQTGAFNNSVSLLAKSAELLDKAADLLAGQAGTDAAVAELKADVADLRASLIPPVNG